MVKIAKLNKQQTSNDNHPSLKEHIIGEVTTALTFETFVGIDMSKIFAVPATAAGEQ